MDDACASVPSSGVYVGSPSKYEQGAQNHISVNCDKVTNVETLGRMCMGTI
jgi:hypothetical protein